MLVSVDQRHRRNRFATGDFHLFASPSAPRGKVGLNPQVLRVAWMPLPVLRWLAERIPAAAMEEAVRGERRPEGLGQRRGPA